MKKITLLLLLLITTGAIAQTLENHWWKPNGPVYTMAQSGNTVYLGGDFTHIGPTVPYGAPLSTSTGAPGSNLASPNGQVNYSIPDGAGGWYISGYFTSIGGQARQGLARINSDGSVHPWNPSLNGSKYALALKDNIVYVSAYFSDETSFGMVALDTTTGNPFWNIYSNGEIKCITVSAGTLYLGGGFSSIGGLSTTQGIMLTRHFAAAFDAATGTPLSWNPNANGVVKCIAVSGNTIYAGGDFNTIGGQIRYSVAALNATTGAASLWNPNPNSTVNTIAVSGSTIYVGGGFSTIGGQPRSRIAALDATSGSATAWNPIADASVRSIYLSGNLLYAGGIFGSIGGQPRYCLAAIDTTTGAPTSWAPNPNESVSTVSVSGNTVYAGGNFTSIGGFYRNNIAAIDATTGAATSWNPNANGTILSMVASGNTVYAGGSFANIGGQARNYIAAIDNVTGMATAWNHLLIIPCYPLPLKGAPFTLVGAFQLLADSQGAG